MKGKNLSGVLIYVAACIIGVLGVSFYIWNFSYIHSVAGITHIPQIHLTLVPSVEFNYILASIASLITIFLFSHLSETKHKRITVICCSLIFIILGVVNFIYL